jgi:hypothetical protein
MHGLAWGAWLPARAPQPLRRGHARDECNRAARGRCARGALVRSPHRPAHSPRRVASPEARRGLAGAGGGRHAATVGAALHVHSTSSFECNTRTRPPPHTHTRGQGLRPHTEFECVPVGGRCAGAKCAVASSCCRWPGSFNFTMIVKATGTALSRFPLAFCAATTLHYRASGRARSWPCTDRARATAAPASELMPLIRRSIVTASKAHSSTPRFHTRR